MSEMEDRTVSAPTKESNMEPMKTNMEPMKIEEQTNIIETRSEDSTKSDPFNWLALQNNELREKIRKLEIGLSQWKLNANETNERLRRVLQNRNKPNYVDSFYDSQTKRLVESLSEENVLLKHELSINDGNSVTKLSELRQTIQILTDQLQIRNNENKLLKNEMEHLTCSNLAIDELKNKVVELNKDYLKITVENTNLKSHARNQGDVMTYLRSEFSKQRKEFLTIFSNHYTQHGEEFIKQLKSLDGGEAPAFLTRPLSRTTRDVTTDTDCDRNKDSGIDTLPDELRELMSKTRELEEAKIEIDRLECELKRKREYEGRMERVLTNSNERYATLEAEGIRVKKERDDAKDDALSWQTALQQFQQERGLRPHGSIYPVPRETSQQFQQEGGLHQHQHGYGSSSIGPREMVQAAEPYQTVVFPHRRSAPQAILVRDSSSCSSTIKRNNNLFPTETQDGSDYAPRGSLPHSASSPDMSSSLPSSPASPPPSGSPRRQERKAASLDYRTVTGKSLYIQCEKCKRPIEAEDFEAHILHCSGST